jgi:hypothetical protein
MGARFKIYCLASLVLLGCLIGCGQAEGAKSAKNLSTNEPKNSLPAEESLKDKAEVENEQGNASDPDKIIAEPPGDKPNRHEPPAGSVAGRIGMSQRRNIDDAKAAASGIRKISGKRLTLYTDMDGAEIDRMPEIFEQAFGQWCEYFHVPSEQLDNWSMTGFLIKDKTRFVQSGLLPGDLPEFLHGFSRGYELWIYDQPSDYYRRHLLLHEGTHGFMNTVLGGCGPPWYMEGMAEMLGTHRWKDDRLQLNYMPQNRDEAPEWGRIRLIKDAFNADRVQSLRTIMENPSFVHGETEQYAWCWAAAYFLDHHPRYRQRFREFYKHVRDPDFNQYVSETFKNDWQELSDQWQVFIAGLEYGYDVARSAIDFTSGKPLPENGATVTIKADWGWQSSGIRLEAGVKYRLAASGRYQVAFESQKIDIARPTNGRPENRSSHLTSPDNINLSPKEPKTWWCEPGGVSIRYYQGRPLGVLLAAIRSDSPERSQAEPGNEKIKETISAFLRPISVGLETSIMPEKPGTLFFRINDSAAELEDNAGSLKVEIKQE